ncbi:nitrite reductase small subunit NirD [Streptomyces sodiiphilus]|uniref:Nitrite reductase small subunit NirD n=1 Tax=Streptomyces sodiiphilus TaxID=226217 RepID=A0ABN2PMZ6_9ACTN
MTTVTETRLPADPAARTAQQRPTGLVEIETQGRWTAVCAAGDLTPGRGVAVLLPDGGQAAVFADRSGRTYAIGNRDPFTGACVLSRGLLGTASGRPYVASPLLKQRFDLIDGRCLDDEGHRVPVWPVRTV